MDKKKVAIRYTQHNGIKLALEKIIKFHPITYKIYSLVKQKFLGSLFVEEDLKGIDKLDLDPNTKCIDVGANTGQSIEYFKKRFKEIYAFEPNPSSFEILKKRYKKYQSIKLYNYALGNTTEEKTLYIPYWKNLISMHQSASLYKEESISTLVEFLSLKKTDITIRTSVIKIVKLNAFNISNVSLVKIDSEGYEKEVLEGMTNYLEKGVDIIIENSERSFNFSKNFLEKFGYQCYRFHNNSFTKKNIEEALNLFFLKKNPNIK